MHWRHQLLALVPRNDPQGRRQVTFALEYLASHPSPEPENLPSALLRAAAAAPEPALHEALERLAHLLQRDSSDETA